MFVCDKFRRDVLFVQFSFVGKYWQVWEFFFIMVVSKSYDDVIYFLLCFCVCLYYRKFEKLIKVEFNVNLEEYICKNICYDWVVDIGELIKEEELVQSFLIKVFDFIVECESDENELKDYQKKMVFILVCCFLVWKFGCDGNLGDLFVFFEYLKVNCILIYLCLDDSLDEVGL